MKATYSATRRKQLGPSTDSTKVNRSNRQHIAVKVTDGYLSEPELLENDLDAKRPDFHRAADRRAVASLVPRRLHVAA